jgi:CRP/FNR family transcriptional regulator, anaerobic regulatory protein
MATLPARALDTLPTGHPCAGCSVRDTAVCGVLPCDGLADFKTNCCTMRLEAGQPLFHEGDPATQVYNVTEGALKLYTLLPDGRRQVMGFILPGDFLGISLGGEHAYTAEALQRTRMCRLSRTRFAEFAGDHPQLEREVYKLAAHELAQAQAQMVLLGRKSALERVASFLLDLERRQRKAAGSERDQVDLPMSRSEIADYLGLTKETVSRIFAELKSRKLIRLITLSRVALLDPERLFELAEGYGEA